MGKNNRQKPAPPAEPSPKNRTGVRSGWPVWLLVFAGGILAGWLASGWLAEKPPVEESVVEIREAGVKKYRYVNPILECANVQWQELRPFRGKIEESLERAVADGKIRGYAVYFRDLNNGWWFGLNEKTDFQQGSLIKVPLLMAFLRQAEKEPEILGRKLVCDTDPAMLIQQNIPPHETLKVGASYTIDDLLRRMIVYSDNAAMDTLVRHTRGEEWFRQTYHDLALPAPGSDSATGEISVKRYASFFRVLFNASYLERESSNRALKLLTETTFRDGLVAGLPRNVEVAHKFGERGDLAGAMQLHDCGIVYHPDTPYLLCVMTRGDQQTQMTSAIAETSRMIYDEVTSQMVR